MILGMTGKFSASSGGTETLLRNRCFYQIPDVVGTNYSTNKKHTFYNEKVQKISRGGGKFPTKVGALCAHFVDIYSKK